MQTVTFKDQGQDFLEWDIENGVVVGCRPFQSRVWVYTRIHNTDIQPGDHLRITTPRGKARVLNYSVESVTKK